MRKFSRISAVLLAAAMLVTAIPLTSLAYGSSDQKLTITHINVAPGYEGAAIICSGELYSLLGTLGTFAWWKTVIFDWDADAKVYKVINIQTNANNYDKSSLEIPDTGFVYGICIGNDYSASGGINYKNQPVIDSHTYVNSLKVGDTAYLYGTDLANGVIQNNGKSWYASDFVSDSFIKIGSPIDGMEAYNPEEEHLLSIDIVPNLINNINYNTGKSIIMTDSHGDYVNYTAGGNFEWWFTVVFDWDDNSGCYVVKSASRQAGNNAPKQPIIPENGFALLDCYQNNTAINNLKIGTKCWLYDINLENGTLGSNPLIRANVPDESRTAYTPNYTKPRLTAPEVNQGANGYINTTDSGVTLTWDSISGASGYMIAINDASAVSDGKLLVKPALVSTNSYTIPSSILSVGGNYTLWIYAVGTNYTASMINCYTVKCLSETAMNSSLVNKKVIAFGDSLTARTGYVSMLYGYIGTEVINAGVGGNNTNHAKARFTDDVLEKDPDIVLICFGMNDQAGVVAIGKPNISLDVYRANLAYFAKSLTDAGKDVVFVTPNPVCTASGYYTPGEYGLDYSYGFMDSFCDAMRQVAIEYNCGLVDINYECDFETLTEFLLSNDGIHQSTYGHTRFAELISDYLLAKYDGINKATMTVNCVDSTGKNIKTVTYTGKVGAHITLAVPEIEGMTCASADIETSFVNGKTYTFTYTAESLVPSEGSGYTVDEDNMIILGVLEKTKASDFVSSFAGEIVLRNKADTADVAATEKVATGMLVKFGGKTYTVAVRGDINGNGEVDATDYALVKRACLGTYTPGDIQITAGDINKTGAIDATDYALVKRHCLGTYVIK